MPLYVVFWVLAGLGLYVVGVPSLLDALVALVGAGVTMNYLDRPLRRK
jgi:hypothetical protein